MATRVTSVKDQVRTALTERSAGRSVCASSVAIEIGVSEIASAAIGFIPCRSSRDVTHCAVRLSHFLNMSRTGGRQVRGFLVLRSRGRGPNQLLLDADQVIPRLGVGQIGR